MMFNYDHNQSLGFLTGIASRLLNNLLVNRFKTAGIDMTAEQWGAVEVLINSGPLTQSELGERLHLEKSSMSRLTTGLEKRGWIARIKDPEDSRRKLVRPTDAVIELAGRCAPIAKKALKDVQQDMEKQQIEAHIQRMKDIIKRLRELT
jgi:MarR family multiple antibiotic resistance transcriptional regulator